MDKPVDGAEALAREVLGKHLEADGFLALAKSARGSGLESMVAAMLAYSAALVAENERLREALTPSGATKAAYIGEFSFTIMDRDEDGEEVPRRVLVPWDTTKEIMAAILARTALETRNG